MFEFISRAIRKRRALRYAKAFPEDLAAVQAILAALDLHAKSAREAADILAGRLLSDSEWRSIADRWERIWNSIR